MTAATFTSATGSASNPTVTVAPDAAVTWNNDSGIVHNVTFANPSAALGVGNGSAGNIPDHSSGLNQRRFASAGSYGFTCTVHGPSMSGTVTVQ